MGRLFVLAEDQRHDVDTLANYRAKRKENSNRYTHWYSYIFCLFPCYSGYRRQTKLDASKKLINCMKGNNDFESLYNSLTAKERGALNQGRLEHRIG